MRLALPLALVLGLAQTSEAQLLEVNWTPGACIGCIPAVGYKVYVNGSAIDVGKGNTEAGNVGILTARVDLLTVPTTNTVIAMTSYDSTGRESVKSSSMTVLPGAWVFPLPTPGVYKLKPLVTTP